MHLKIKAENEAKPYYENHSTFHDGDSGLDLFVPVETVVPARSIGFKVNMLISCEPFEDRSKNNGVSYYCI